MKKSTGVQHGQTPVVRQRLLSYRALVIRSLAVLCVIGFVYYSFRNHVQWALKPSTCHSEIKNPKYEQLPLKDDPFHFIPCTHGIVLPRLNDTHHESTWAAQYDPNPDNYTWGPSTPKHKGGIYLCGYLDVPVDYHNKTEERIFRLAVTKYQVSGLACADGDCSPTDGQKSKRTIVTEPGGPGGSGTLSVFNSGWNMSEKYSDGQYDVLGWDPRGVNLTQPAVSCFPHLADRDRWKLLANQLPEAAGSPRQQLETADALYEATFVSCKATLDDLPQFVSTAAVVRDLDQIRSALGEEELTGYVVSYGTTIGQIYANMFPDRVGRFVLDGVCYAKGDRDIMGFAKTALGNVTDAWRDGFIGECVDAGPEHCELAKPWDGKATTSAGLEKRLDALLQKLKTRPMPAYTESSGPSVIRYAEVLDTIYLALYSARKWPALAEMLAGLERGNTTLAAEMVEQTWKFDPSQPVQPSRVDWGELTVMVICADSFDSPREDTSLDWWEAQWKEMYEEEHIGGSINYRAGLVCRHYREYWPTVADAYRGELQQHAQEPGVVGFGDVRPCHTAV